MVVSGRVHCSGHGHWQTGRDGTDRKTVKRASETGVVAVTAGGRSLSAARTIGCVESIAGPAATATKRALRSSVMVPAATACTNGSNSPLVCV